MTSCAVGSGKGNQSRDAMYQDIRVWEIIRRGAEVRDIGDPKSQNEFIF